MLIWESMNVNGWFTNITLSYRMKTIEEEKSLFRDKYQINGCNEQSQKKILQGYVQELY